MERIEEVDPGLEDAPTSAPSPSFPRKMSLEGPQRRLSPHPQPAYRGGSPMIRQRKMSFPATSPSLSSYQLIHDIPDAAKRYRRSGSSSESLRSIRVSVPGSPT